MNINCFSFSIMAILFFLALFNTTISYTNDITSSSFEKLDNNVESLKTAIIDRLIKSGWDKDSAVEIARFKNDYFVSLIIENSQNLENEIVKFEKIGKYPYLVFFLKQHPVMSDLINQSKNQQLIANSLNDDEYYEIIDDLYRQCVSPKEVDLLAEALENNRNLICRLIQRGFNGVEELFIFIRDNSSSEIYDVWLQDVLNTYISSSDDDLGLIITLLLAQGPEIRQRMVREEDFRNRFLDDLWPKFRQIINQNPEFFKFYILEPKIWDLLSQPYGDELLENYGFLPIHFFYGEKSYPTDLHPIITQVLLQSNEFLIQAFDKFREDQQFLQLLRRQLSSSTIAAVIKKLYDAGPNYPKELSYYLGKSDSIIAKDVGTLPPSLLNKSNIYTLCEKLWEERYTNFDDWFNAGLELFFVTNVFKISVPAKKIIEQFDNFSGENASKQLLKNIKSIKSNESFLVKEGRKNINSKYAGKTKILSEKLQEKYKKKGIKFNKDGFPEFGPVCQKSVDIDDLKYDSSDFIKANKAIGLNKTPKGYTWHHHENGKTMQLVPSDIHSEIRHTGGVAIWK